MKSANNYFIAGMALSLTALCLVVSVEAQESGRAEAMDYVSSHRWVSSTVCVEGALCITLHDGDELKVLAEGKAGEHNNLKPVWSREGDMITWFRPTGGSDMRTFNLFESHICVINADGTGYRELTDDSNANLNPTWTRDGSNKIIFNRYDRSGADIDVYWIDPNGEKNSEELIGTPRHEEWAESGLKDGRIFA